MRFKVLTPPQVEDDLNAIFYYIADHDRKAAQKFVKALRKSIKSLARMPRRHPLAPENGLDDQEIRHLTHGRYRIIYTIREKRVFIIEVRHGARLPITEMTS